MEQKLLEIANQLNFTDLADELEMLRLREDNPNAPLILPLVGEFNAGKTTFLNALLDHKDLETGNLPTTATRYEIHFSSPKSYAVVTDEAGRKTTVEDISQVKNATLKNATLVQVYDTSTRIPANIVFVDTPGLSSTDIKHQQNLVQSLPDADAILLFVDINPQLQKSTIQFIRRMAPAKRPIFLILTKSDTKTAPDIETSKHYIQQHHQDLNLASILCISAAKNQMDEFFDLLKKLQTEKNAIQKVVNTARLHALAQQMNNRLQVLIDSSSSDVQAAQMLKQEQLRLQQLTNALQRVVYDLQTQVQKIEDDTVRELKSSIFLPLESLSQDYRTDYDLRATEIINNTTSLLLHNYQQAVQKLFLDYANKTLSEEFHISLASLTQVDLTSQQLHIDNTFQLDQTGHQYDEVIARSMELAGKIALMVLIKKGKLPKISLGAMLPNDSSETSTQQQEGSTSLQEGKEKDNAPAEETPSREVHLMQKLQESGVLHNACLALVRRVTDKALAKPQRRRIIYDFLDHNLIPSFRRQLNQISHATILQTQQIVTAEAQEDTQQITQKIEELQQLRTQREEEFKTKMAAYKEYKKYLQQYLEETK